MNTRVGVSCWRPSSLHFVPVVISQKEAPLFAGVLGRNKGVRERGLALALAVASVLHEEAGSESRELRKLPYDQFHTKELKALLHLLQLYATLMRTTGVDDGGHHRRRFW